MSNIIISYDRPLEEVRKEINETLTISKELFTSKNKEFSEARKKVKELALSANFNISSKVNCSFTSFCLGYARLTQKVQFVVLRKIKLLEKFFTILTDSAYFQNQTARFDKVIMLYKTRLQSELNTLEQYFDRVKKMSSPPVDETEISDIITKMKSCLTITEKGIETLKNLPNLIQRYAEGIHSQNTIYAKVVAPIMGYSQPEPKINTYALSRPSFSHLYINDLVMKLIDFATPGFYGPMKTSNKYVNYQFRNSIWFSSQGQIIIRFGNAEEFDLSFDLNAESIIDPIDMQDFQNLFSDMSKHKEIVSEEYKAIYSELFALNIPYGNKLIKGDELFKNFVPEFID